MAEHQCFSVHQTNYMRNFDPDGGNEVYAVHYEAAPRRNEDGSTTHSLIIPALIVSAYLSEPEQVAQRVAEILNQHWDDGDAPADTPPIMDVGAVAIDMVIASLSKTQVRLLTRLTPKSEFWVYRVETRVVALQTAMALAKRGIILGGDHRPYENGGFGYVHLTPFGIALRKIIMGRSA